MIAPRPSGLQPRGPFQTPVLVRVTTVTGTKSVHGTVVVEAHMLSALVLALALGTMAILARVMFASRQKSSGSRRTATSGTGCDCNVLWAGGDNSGGDCGPGDGGGCGDGGGGGGGD